MRSDELERGEREPTVPDLPTDGSMPAEFDGPSQELPKGHTLGRYVVIDRIGAGAMGVVYRAHDPDLDRTVAIKVLRQEPFAQGDPGGEARLLREAQALARLSHPNVVPVYDVGLVHDNEAAQVYVAMEFVRGRTLRRWLREDRPWQEKLSMIVTAGRGLAAAHRADLIHRDVKPDNIIIDEQGRARMMDFGLARGRREVHTAGPGISSEEIDSLSATLTRTGSVVGTPAYMPPEQHTGQPIDQRADQFALCVVAFEALFGQRPYDARDIHAMARQKVRGEIRSFEPGDVPQEVVEVVLRGLAPSPNHRWPSLTDLLDALQRSLEPRRRRWPWLLGGVALTVVMVLSTWWSSRATHCDRAQSQWSQVWNRETAGAIETAYVEVSPSYGTRGFRSVREGLDSYGEAWIAAYRSTCEELHADPTPTLDRQMMCLQRRRRSVEHLVSILSDPTPQVVLRSASLIAGIAPPTRCSDLEGVEPLGEDEAALIDLAVAWIDRSDAHERAGQPKRAIHAALAGWSIAQVTSSDALRARADLELGFVLKALGHYRAAEQHYNRAYERAVAAGLDELALRAATRLVFVVGSRQERPEAGLHWARVAHALVRRIGAPTDSRWALLENEASVLSHAGRHQDALQQLEAVLELRRSDVSDPDLKTAMVYNNMGTILPQVGRYRDALQVHRRALEIRQRIVGEEHPLTAMSDANIAIAYTNLEAYDKALPHARKALEVWTRFYGEDHPHVAAALTSLAAIELRTGDTEAALRNLQRIVDIRTKRMSDNPQAMSDAYANLAAGFLAADRHEEARVAVEHALAIIQGASGLQGRDWAGLYANLGLASLELGDLEDAEHYSLRAIELFEDHPAASYPLTTLGRLYLTTGRPHEALASLQKCAELREELNPTPRSAIADYLLGRALWESGEDKLGGWALVQLAKQQLADAPAQYDRERGWIAAFEAEHEREALGLAAG